MPSLRTIRGANHDWLTSGRAPRTPAPLPLHLAACRPKATGVMEPESERLIETIRASIIGDDRCWRAPTAPGG